MKKSTFLISFCVLFIVSTVEADDVIIPSWRGQDRTVKVVWDYWGSNGDGPRFLWQTESSAGFEANPGGFNPLTQRAYAYLNNNVSILDNLGRTNVLEVHPGGYLSFGLPDYNDGAQKLVLVQVTWHTALAAPMYFEIGGLPGEPNQLPWSWPNLIQAVVLNAVDHNDGWITCQYGWIMEPNPSYEGFRILFSRWLGDDYTAYVDQVVIDTICPGDIKWSQRPVPDPNLSDTYIGWDEESHNHLPRMVADDFSCDSDKPVTAIRWWGSFLGWDQNDVPLGELPDAFYLTIWSDVPDPNPGNPNTYSHPSQIVWEKYCDSYDVNFYGWEFDPNNPYDPCDPFDSMLAKFEFYQALDPCDYWYQITLPLPPPPRIYWLGIMAIYDGNEPNYPWGWETREHFFNDDAVRFFGYPVSEVNYPAEYFEPIEFQSESWDLSFELITLEEPPVTYVDMDANGSNDGSSWCNAYNYLQDALADPNACVIWVADGDYYPDSNSSQPNGSGDMNASFVLKDGVAIYGGFAGCGAANPNTRDVKLYETILSGDLAGNDVYVSDPCNLLTDPCRAENSYHVVDGSNTNASAVIDGFTITAGNANGASWPNRHGGGMFNFQANCTVNQCTFIDNSSTYGGGMCGNTDSDLCVSNCTFIRNVAMSNGGGIDFYRSNYPMVTNCTFIENVGVKAGGGGMTVVDSNCPTITNCRFISNKGLASGNNGGGLYDVNSNPTVMNCLFTNNSAEYSGAIFNINGSCPSITNCTFSGNLGAGGCGCINDYNNSSPIITNCILWDNTAPQICESLGSTATVNYSDIQGGWSGAGGNNINADPRFLDADGWDNIVGTLDENLRLSWNSPCIDVGDNNAVPSDTADLDDDGNTIEQTPLDLDSRPRFVDGDCNGTVIVDMGAYEFNYAYAGDFDGDCDIDFFDFAILANSWLQNDPLRDIAPPPAGDDIVDIYDLAVLCDNWLAGK